MKYKTRIKEIREAVGLTQKALADAVGTTPETISRLENDKRQVDINWLKRIAPALNRHPQELIADNGDAISMGQSFGNNIVKGDAIPLRTTMGGDYYEKISTAFGIADVPIIGNASGSSDSVILNFDTGIIGFAMRHPKQQGLNGAFALYARGESMSPRYNSGELVYSVSCQSPVRGQDTIVELNNGEGFIKIFVRQTDKDIICKQLNPAKEWKRPLSEVKALHAVVGRG